MFDLISIGDAAVDLFFQIHDAQIETEKGTRELCVRFGDKIPVDKFAQVLGGNSCNNAVGAVRLGMKTAVYLNVGTDLAGKFTLSELKEEKVDVRYITVNEGMDSNISALITFEGERTILTYRQSFKYKLPDLDKTRWVYLSSMGKTAIEDNLNGQVENYLSMAGAPLIYNPGPYELNFGIKKFSRLLSLTKLLILNKEEAEQVLGDSKDIKKLLVGLAEFGPQMVIITDGKNGSYGYDGEKLYKLEAFPANLAQTTGAGDG
ncbi:MAG: carbohydrate kinase family protein, partial [Patescibacteria group bacterium]